MTTDDQKQTLIKIHQNAEKVRTDTLGTANNGD